MGRWRDEGKTSARRHVWKENAAKVGAGKHPSPLISYLFFIWHAAPFRSVCGYIRNRVAVVTLKKEKRGSFRYLPPYTIAFPTYRFPVQIP